MVNKNIMCPIMCPNCDNILKSAGYIKMDNIKKEAVYCTVCDYIGTL